VVISLEHRLRRIRVLAVDPRPSCRDAVARAMRRQPQSELVGEVAGREALEEINRLRPEVAVLDLRLPALDGPRILNAVTHDGLPMRIVLLSATVKADTPTAPWPPAPTAACARTPMPRTSARRSGRRHAVRRSRPGRSTRDLLRAPGAGDFVHLPPEYLEPDPVLASLVSPTLATSRMSTTEGHDAR
jgi:chemotaxis response regulator CheB